MSWPTRKHLSSRGFTLIELLIAVTLMAMMAALSWRGLDGMLRAQAQTQQYSDDLFALKAGLAQWGSDLDAVAVEPGTPSLEWDGRSLRILRRNTAVPGEGLRVVAWSRRVIEGTGQWLRWQSAPLKSRAEARFAWQTAERWAQNPGDHERLQEVRIVPLERWEIFYYRGDAWSHPLSSDGADAHAQADDQPATPDGVRLVLHLPPGHALGGVLTRDWFNAVSAQPLAPARPPRVEKPRL